MRHVIRIEDGLALYELESLVHDAGNPSISVDDEYCAAEALWARLLGLDQEDAEGAAEGWPAPNPSDLLL
jgi:ATP-dependent helicase YprA (DUF1998 family)